METTKLLKGICELFYISEKNELCLLVLPMRPPLRFYLANVHKQSTKIKKKQTIGLNLRGWFTSILS